jgi:hypothetical protein
MNFSFTSLDEPSVAVLKDKVVNADFDGALQSEKKWSLVQLS